MNDSDRLVRAIDRATNIRVAIAITTGVVAEAQKRHHLSPAATIAVGRALTSGLLLATLTKGDERVTLQIMGDGPLGSITVDALGNGDARGYVQHPTTGTLAGPGRPRLADVVGKHGVVNVLRDLGLKELYQGQTALATGEVDEDVEAYLRMSEQVPSALGCEVVLDGDRVVAAAGLLVQAMPNGDAAIVDETQRVLRSDRLYEILAAGEREPIKLARGIFPAGPLEVVGDDRSLRFQCRCSAEKIAQVLQLLGTVDLDEMIAEDKPAEIACNYCNTQYRIGREVLERIRAGRTRESN